MTTEQPTSGQLEEVLTAAIRHDGQPDGIVTSWVIVCEVLEGSTGSLSLITLCDPVQPFWRHRGMLEHAAVPSEFPDDDDD